MPDPPTHRRPPRSVGRRARRAGSGESRAHHHSYTDHGWSLQEAVATLESPERRKALDPEGFWDRVGLARGQTVADVGAGTGFFALPAARRVAPGGQVYAIDLSKDLLAYLQERAVREGVTNLRAVLARPGAIPLPTGCADLVLFANVLHDLSPDSTVEAIRLVHPGGRVANLDWSDRAEGIGPPRAIRLSAETAIARFRELGFEPISTFEAGPYHYAGVFRRSLDSDSTG